MERKWKIKGKKLKNSKRTRLWLVSREAVIIHNGVQRNGYLLINLYARRRHGGTAWGGRSGGSVPSVGGGVPREKQEKEVTGALTMKVRSVPPHALSTPSQRAVLLTTFFHTLSVGIRWTLPTVCSLLCLSLSATGSSVTLGEPTHTDVHELSTSKLQRCLLVMTEKVELQHQNHNDVPSANRSGNAKEPRGIKVLLQQAPEVQYDVAGRDGPPK